MKFATLRVVRALIALFLLLPGLSSCSGKAPVELGKVAWGKDFDAALVAAGKQEKPVFLLFQEVPGCAGCRQFGQEVLSDPRLVRVIEREFVPVMQRNNVGGKEAEVRERYGEPAWNYQVMRFLDAGGKDLIPRRDKVWETRALAVRMKKALKVAGKEVPEDLERIIDGRPEPEAEAVFAMYCFWTGEAKLGAIEGVRTTEAGFFDGREVVRVKYDASVITRDELLAKAEKFDCARKIYLPPGERASVKGAKIGVFNESDYRRAPESDQKRQLIGTPLKELKMNPEQATKVNAWIRRDRKKALGYLTPEQQVKITGN